MSGRLNFSNECAIANELALCLVHPSLSLRVDLPLDDPRIDAKRRLAKELPLNEPFGLPQKCLRVLDIPMQEFHSSIVFLAVEHPMHSVVDPAQLSGHLTEQKARSPKRPGSFAQFGNILTELQYSVRRLQCRTMCRVAHDQLKSDFVPLRAKLPLKLLDLYCPSEKRGVNRHSNPHGSTFRLAASTSRVQTGKRQRSNHSPDCANRCPRIPPHNAVLRQRPALADALHPTHSLIPLWIGRHSAMRPRARAASPQGVKDVR